MNAKKCDRCGKYYEPYQRADSHMTSTGNTVYNVKFNCVKICIDDKWCGTFDLCPECAKDFNKWINNR